MTDWASPQGLRIWRSLNMDFYGEEAIDAAGAYTDEQLASIAADGFNAVWVRGKLHELVQTETFPELADEKRAQRIDSLRAVIERGRQQGIALYLYFNEPLSLPVDDPFWQSHPDLRGVEYEVPIYIPRSYALCTSTPAVQAYLREAIGQVFQQLDGLGGVIQITASEFLTHCWSHYARYSLGDNIHEPTDEPLGCPRCRDREPADVVAELLGVWADQAARQPTPPRVLAWNWSWSLWYPDPQKEVIEKLPPGVELMADWERGGHREHFGRDILIDEYSLGYTGPGERFAESARVARDKTIPMHAKMQLGTTHELATVPNLPLMESLCRKLCGLSRLEIDGILGSWNIGLTPTLNRYAVGLYTRMNSPLDNADGFLDRLAEEYFGPVDVSAIRAGWRAFSDAFTHYPLSIAMVYYGPINYAPAYPLSLQYRAKPMGPSWQVKYAWGDRLEDCLGHYTLEECITLLTELRAGWADGLDGYVAALSADTDGTADQRRHRHQERSVAMMIDVHLESMVNIFRFHQWRLAAMDAAGSTAPCTVQPDEQALALMRAELANTRRALPLLGEDDRLGYHEEDHSHMITEQMLQAKIEQLESDIGRGATA